MSMNPEQENFEALRRMLALKRHEQPPPGFFNDFSQQVIARLRAGEKPEEPNFWEEFFQQAPWLQRLWAAFENKPLFASAFGVVISGLLISGAIYSAKFDGASGGPEINPQQQALIVPPGGAPAPTLTETTPSTNGIQGSRSVFDGIQLPDTRLINFETLKQN
jgi:hypothetical protein